MAWPEYKYNLSRPYPWKYTSWIVTFLTVAITISLVLLNIPLSGYEIQQDFTYTPNDTGTTLPYSSIVPAPIRKRSISFIPHTFVIGETFQTDSDFGLFDYKIGSANHLNDTPGSSTPRVGAEVSSFLYMNHGLSTCDVISITLDTTLPPPRQPWAYPHTVATALISCWFPLFYQFRTVYNYQATLVRSPSFDFLRVGSAIMSIIENLDAVLHASNTTTNVRPGGTYANRSLKAFAVTYHRCCATCNSSIGSMSDLTLEPYEILSANKSLFFYDHPTCDEEDVKFNLPSYYLAMTGQTLFKGLPVLTFMDGTVDIGYDHIFGNFSDFISHIFVNGSDDFPTLTSNALKGLYHAIRLDLGIIRPNQIYNSPSRFNASINEISQSGQSQTTTARANRVLVGDVDLSNYNTRVPRILYLASELTRKPLGQAIVAVFVSTFSMMMALWQGCNFVATYFATLNSKEATFCPCPACDTKFRGIVPTHNSDQ